MPQSLTQMSILISILLLVHRYIRWTLLTRRAVWSPCIVRTNAWQKALAATLLFTAMQKTDGATIFWGVQGHYSAVINAAQIVETETRYGISPFALAFYAEVPDQLEATTAFCVSPAIIVKAVLNIPTCGLAAYNFDQIQRQLHSLNGGLASHRQQQLAKLIQGQLSKASAEPWKLGFLVHAYGDSFAHCYKDKRRWIPSAIGAPKSRTMVPNQNYDHDVLYEAPLGHMVDGDGLDLVRENDARFESYFRNLVITLNNGPLSAEQQARTTGYLSLIRKLLADPKIPERDAFKKTHIDYGFDPTATPWYGAFLTKTCFLRHVDNIPGFSCKLPTDLQVFLLTQEIKRQPLP